MVEETGVVTAINGEFAWIETQPKSVCGHCNVAKSCGTSVLAKWFSRKRNEVQVINELNLQPGDSAVVGVSNEVLIKAAFIAYMLPLLAMVTLAILGSLLGANTIGVILCSVTGLIAGLWSISPVNNWSGQGKHPVRLIRKLAVANGVQLTTNY
jgi:sigma-E factor negative regulatory protein RseC